MKKILSVMLCLLMVIVSLQWTPNNVSAVTDDSNPIINIKPGKTVENYMEGGITKTFAITPSKVGQLSIMITCYVNDDLRTSLFPKDNDKNKMTKDDIYIDDKGFTTVKYLVYVSPRTYYLTLYNPTIITKGSVRIETSFTAIKSNEGIAVNNTKDKAVGLSNNKYYRGVLACDEDFDFYSIKFTKKTKFSVNISCFDEVAFDIIIKDEKGNILDKGWTHYNTIIYSYSAVVSPGKYYIIIQKTGKDNMMGRSYDIALGSYRTIADISIPNKKTLTVGSSYFLKPVIEPENATEKYSYTSSNKRVVKVSSNGKLTALKKGTATITVKTANRAITSTCKVTVKEVAVTKITLNKKSTTLYVGGKTKLKASVLPSNATHKNVTWKSSNSKVATVSSSGYVTAKGIGTCKIVAKAGRKSATCIIVVKARPRPTPTPTPIPKPTQKPTPTPKLTPKPTQSPTPTPVLIDVESISLTSTLKLKVGDTKVLSVTILPDNASDKKLVWFSNNADIVSVENGKITCNKAGKATIIAVTSNGKKAYCTVIVEER